MAEGLADTSTVTIPWDTGQKDRRGKPLMTTKEVHRVQILDPATGTGTFLAEVIKQIAPRVIDKASGIWAHYVEKDLIPRLHGFELLMASYAMCHLKLEMVLREYGYQPTASPPRVSVYLTNSLEEGEAANWTLPFAQWLSNEVKEANKIKRDMPIMCVIGNPPYRGDSENRGAWIMGLMEAYKKEPGKKTRLNERNPKWINDDYVKFIRMAEATIAKNGQGVLGFITNHSYLDNPTFRAMRWHLLRTFDKLYVLDLHGNAKRGLVTPDGEPDKNVFDIQQGVAILVAIKHSSEKKQIESLASLDHFDFWGERKTKYEMLFQQELSSIGWRRLHVAAPRYLFTNVDHQAHSAYEEHLSIAELFSPNGRPAPGIVTTHDQFAVSFTRKEAVEKVEALLRSSSEAEARSKFRLCSQGQWSYATAKNKLSTSNWRNTITEVLYRPFDKRVTVYDANVAVHRRTRMTSHFVGHPNIGLLTSRLTKGENFAHVLVTDTFTEAIVLSPKTSNNGFNFPLYLYPCPAELDQSRRVNFDPKIYSKIRKLATHTTRGEPDEVEVFDYVYGVLHCPAYRKAYAEFLRIDFPRVPWPSSPESFWDVSDKGRRLRRLHLMELDAIGSTPYPFVGDGPGQVEKPEFRNGHVWIDSNQRFENVPEEAWTFYVGGYQPAQKWLKDRKGRTLDYAGVQHYQRMLKVFVETDRIMSTINLPLDVEKVA